MLITFKRFHEKVTILVSWMVLVEKRVSEVERNLNKHLKKRDKVLNLIVMLC